MHDRIPVDVLRIIVSFDQCMGLWVGTSLILVCRRLGWVAKWALMNTHAGRHWLTKIIATYADRRALALPDWITSEQLWMVFGEQDDVHEMAIAVAVENDDTVVLEALCAGGRRDLLQWHIRDCVTRGSVGALRYFMRNAPDLFGLATIECVCADNSALLDVLMEEARSDDQRKLVESAMHPGRGGDAPGGLLQDMINATIRRDNGALLRRLYDAGRVDMQSVASMWIMIGPHCARCVADVFQGGVAWLASVNYLGNLVKCLSTQQAIEFLALAAPQRDHLFVAAAENPDINVLAWAAKRWADIDETVVSVAARSAASAAHTIWILRMFCNRLSMKGWAEIVAHFMVRNRETFDAINMHFQGILNRRCMWNRVPSVDLLSCDRSFLRKIADRGFLTTWQCTYAIAQHDASSQEQLPDSLLRRVVGKRLVVSAINVALGLGFHRNAQWLFDNTKWEPRYVAARHRRIRFVVAAMESHSLPCFKWAADRFCLKWTPLERGLFLDTYGRAATGAMQQYLMDKKYTE